MRASRAGTYETLPAHHENYMPLADGRALISSSHLINVSYYSSMVDPKARKIEAPTTLFSLFHPFFPDFTRIFKLSGFLSSSCNESFPRLVFTHVFVFNSFIHTERWSESDDSMSWYPHSQLDVYHHMSYHHGCIG